MMCWAAGVRSESVLRRQARCCFVDLIGNAT
jgi:hypothetical protein